MKVIIHGVSFEVDTNVKADKKFWGNVNSGKWEPHTFNILDRFLNFRHSMIDLGGYIGPTTLYGAHFAKHVHVVEPDPSALHALRLNVAANSFVADRTTIYDFGISNKSGDASLCAPGKFKFGESGSTIVKKSGFEMLIPVLSFDDFIRLHKINDCGFVKMDIEGAEYLVLPTMKDFFEEFMPTLYISFHKAGKLKEKNREAIEDALLVYNDFFEAKTMLRIALNEVCDQKEVVVA